MKRIGLAERSGRGVDRIFEGSLQYGRDIPDYSETTATSVKLFIPRGMPDQHIVSLVSEEQRRTGEPLPLSALLALNILKQGRRMSLTEISREANMSETKMRSNLERLTESGMVEAVGNGRGQAYILSAKVYKDPAKYVRQTDIDKLRYPELIRKLAKSRGVITRKDVVELLRVSPPQAYRILQKMLEEGEIVREGNTRAAVYRIAQRDREVK